MRSPPHREEALTSEEQNGSRKAREGRSGSDSKISRTGPTGSGPARRKVFSMSGIGREAEARMPRKVTPFASVAIVAMLPGTEPAAL